MKRALLMKPEQLLEPDDGGVLGPRAELRTPGSAGRVNVYAAIQSCIYNLCQKHIRHRRTGIEPAFPGGHPPNLALTGMEGCYLSMISVLSWNNIGPSPPRIPANTAGMNPTSSCCVPITLVNGVSSKIMFTMCLYVMPCQLQCRCAEAAGAMALSARILTEVG